MNIKLLSPIVLATLLGIGCTACKTSNLPAKSFKIEEASVTRAEAQNFWLKKLEQQKPDLHAMTLLAMLISKDTGKEIFVLSKTNDSRSTYLISSTRGNSDNLFSYNHKENYFSFDHYNLISKDGPSLSDSTYELEISRKVQAYYKELGVK